MIDVSFIIINYNTKDITSECINSVIKYTTGITFEVILVDNASTDGSKEIFEIDNRIKYIYENTNHGFGIANNIGVANAKGEYVFLLNSDTLLHEDSCKILCDMLKAMPEVGVIGPILVDEKGVNNGSYYDFRNCNPFKRICYRIRRKKILKEIESNFKENGYICTGYVSGAAMMMRRDIFNKIGGFDPDFFMYYEEQDLQRRVANLGLKRISTNKTKIYHIHGYSTNGCLPAQKIRLRQKSLHLYGTKHFKGVRFFLFCTLNLIGFVYYLFSNNYTLKDRLSLIKDELLGYR